MKNEFVSYEIALKLKKLGFNEPCFYQYVKDFDNDGELIPITSETNHPILRNNHQVSHCSGGDCFAAPLYQQAFKFFREKFNWQASIEATKDQHSHELGYNYFIWNSETGLEYHTMPKDKPSGDWEFNTYEEAEIACLIKLIEIIKNETK